MLVNLYETTQHQILDYSIFHSHYQKNLNLRYTHSYVIIRPCGNPVDLEYKFLDSHPEDSEFSTPSDMHVDWFTRDWMPLPAPKVGGACVCLECCPENIKMMKSEEPKIIYTGIHKLLSVTLVLQWNHIQVCVGIFLFATTSRQAVGLRSLLSNGYYVVFPKG